MDDERRSFKRLPAEAEVKVRKIDSQVASKGAGKNLSGGGIQFLFNEELEIGSLVDIEVIHPSHPTRPRDFPPLKARIRIVRVEGELPPFDIAGEFIEVS